MIKRSNWNWVGHLKIKETQLLKWWVRRCGEFVSEDWAAKCKLQEERQRKYRSLASCLGGSKKLEVDLWRWEKWQKSEACVVLYVAFRLILKFKYMIFVHQFLGGTHWLETHSEGISMVNEQWGCASRGSEHMSLRMGYRIRWRKVATSYE